MIKGLSYKYASMWTYMLYSRKKWSREDLSRHTGTKTDALYKALKDMEKKGYVVRVKDGRKHLWVAKKPQTKAQSLPQAQKPKPQAAPRPDPTKETKGQSLPLDFKALGGKS